MLTRRKAWYIGFLFLSACSEQDTPVRWARGSDDLPTRWERLPAELRAEPVVGVPGLSRDALQRAIEEAVDAWGVSTEVQVTLLESPLRESSEDGRSVVRLSTRDAAGVHGVTKLYSRRTPSGAFAEIIEADIEINRRSLETDHEVSEKALKKIVLHEMGHFFGLDHPCERVSLVAEGRHAVPCDERHRRLLMFPSVPGEGTITSLEPSRGERAAVHEAYRIQDARIRFSGWLLALGGLVAVVIWVLRAVARRRVWVVLRSDPICKKKPTP